MEEGREEGEVRNLRLASAFLESRMEGIGEGDASGFEEGASEMERSLWGVLRDGKILVE